nr:MAG TPA: hypothetical protein [Caudoviricetes sp.]
MATAQKSAIYTVQSVILKVAYIANQNLSSKSGTGGLTMAEYIDRAAAVKSVLRMRRPENSVAQNRMLSIIQMDMLKLPAADVVPVVRGW